MTSASADEPTRITGVDVDLACLTSASIADTDRPLVVCIHGFPDSAHTWRHLMPTLDAHGYRVVAPFIRGYAPTSVAANGAYQTGASSMDAIGIHEHFGGDDRAVIIGHDWGAPITYGAATHAPQRWAKVIGMAVPPGGAMGLAFVSNNLQLKRSWYMFFFQHGLADIVVPADDFAFIDMIWADWSPGYDATEDLVRVKHALRDPANTAAALGYYRATLGDGFVDPRLNDVQAATQAVPAQPTLYLHGANDGCVGAEVAESARAMVSDNVTVDVLADVGHFLHLEDPEVVNNRILEFLT